MNECHDPLVSFSDDQAGRLKVNRTQCVRVQFVHVRNGRAEPDGGVAWFHSRTREGGSEFRNERNRVTGLDHRSEFEADGKRDSTPQQAVGPDGWNRRERTSNSGHSNQHVVALDLDLVDWLFDFGTQGSLARPDIELPAMPGASDHRSLDDPVGEWSSLMRANSIDGRHDPIDVIRTRIYPPLKFNFFAGTYRQIFRLASLTNRGIGVTPVPSRSRPAFSTFNHSKSMLDRLAHSFRLHHQTSFLPDRTLFLKSGTGMSSMWTLRVAMPTTACGARPVAVRVSMGAKWMNRVPGGDVGTVFDLVVVGGGMGGLATAAPAQRLGLRFAPFGSTHQAWAAGYFRRGDCCYDVGATALTGFNAGEPIGDLLAVLGIDFHAEPTSSYRVHLPDRTLDIVAEQDKFERAAVAAFSTSTRLSAVRHRVFWRLQEGFGEALFNAASSVPRLPVRSLSDLIHDLRVLRPVGILAGTTSLVTVQDVLDVLWVCTAIGHSDR